MYKELKYKDRDNMLLYDLFRYRLLTVDQIKTLYFKSKQYAYKRLHVLKYQGLINSKPMVKNNGQKSAACYYITNKGISRLLDKKMITKGKKAYDNLPKNSKINMTIDTNELYVQLAGAGFTFIEGREWKVLQNVNYRSYVRGGLVTKDGKEYAVYMLDNKAHDETIKEIKREIGKEHQSGKFLVFFKGPESFKKFRSQLTGDELAKIEYCLMPYNFIALRLPFFAENFYFVKVITKYGEVRKNENYSDSTSFAEYILKNKDGKEYYVCNYLLLDEAALGRVKNYPAFQYKNDGRKILIVCWTEFIHLIHGMNDLDFVEILEVKEEDYKEHSFYEEIKRRQREMDFRNPMADE